jgi:hypothetical protein
MEKVANMFVVVSLIIFALTGYAAYKENELTDKFDYICRDSGGIPLRATYHYDPKDNKIHYVCLKSTSIMEIEE